MERRKGDRYSKDFKKQAVERMNAGGNMVKLAREIGTTRRLLCVWRDRLDETNPSASRSRELILRKQILQLKRLLANETLEVDFFRRALQKVGARRPKKSSLGDEASMRK